MISAKEAKKMASDNKEFSESETIKKYLQSVEEMIIRTAQQGGSYVTIHKNNLSRTLFRAAKEELIKLGYTYRTVGITNEVFPDGTAAEVSWD